MISELTEQGALISVATARTPATVEPILGDTLTAGELVVMTGSAIWDRRSRRFVAIKLLPERDVEKIHDVFGRHGVSAFCYVLNGDNRYLDVYHESAVLTAPEDVFVRERAALTLKGFHLGKGCPRELYGRVVLFFGLGCKDAIVGVAEELRRLTDCYVSYYKDNYSEDMWMLEIFAPGVSKAAGMKLLKERLGVDRVVAFGDNLNDIPMLQAADVAVVVENALDDVKAVADFVIGPNTEPSVAEFIRKDFLGEID